MNAAFKARLANIFTAVVAIITIVQGSLLANAPFSTSAIEIMGIVFTYLALALTAWKQYLSPDVNNSAQQVTIWVAVITTIAGLGELINIFHLQEATQNYIKWTISIIVTVVNILSKQLFPSYEQKVKMNELKQSS